MTPRSTPAGRVLVALVVMLAAACAARRPPPPVATPRYADYVQPQLPVGDPRAAELGRGWQWLQGGDPRTAERVLRDLLRGSPGLVPVETALAYAILARGDTPSALAQFDRALRRDAGYAPALAGRGFALVSAGRDAEALVALDAAQQADPRVDLSARIEGLRFKSVEAALSAARQARGASDLDGARRAYQRALSASPTSGFLYRELAEVEELSGQRTEALDHARRAAELDPSDASALALVGRLLEALGDDAGAVSAYDRALALEPSADLVARRDAARSRAATARLPAEYRAIEGLAAVTRGDLAALLGVRLGDVLRGAGSRTVLVTDLRTHWAAEWIHVTLKAGVLEAFPNHTFQPAAAVRRADLAGAVARTLALLEAGGVARWTGAKVAMSDLSAGHPAYGAASVSVAAGILALTGDRSFQPQREVSGAEAIEAVARLSALASRAPGR